MKIFKLHQKLKLKMIKQFSYPTNDTQKCDE